MERKIKRPSFQFYPNDWYSDIKLRSISLGARGLWIDILCIFHQSDYRYGFFPSMLVKKPIDLPDIGTDKVNPVDAMNRLIEVNPEFCSILARMVGEKEQITRSYLMELAGAGVFSFTEDGFVYSKRMVMDEELRNMRAKAGAIGGAIGGKAKKTKYPETNKEIINQPSKVIHFEKNIGNDSSSDVTKIDAVNADEANLRVGTDEAYYVIEGEYPLQRLVLTVSQNFINRMKREFPTIDPHVVIRDMEYYWNTPEGFSRRPKSRVATALISCANRALKRQGQKMIPLNDTGGRTNKESTVEFVKRFNTAVDGLLPKIDLPISPSRESLVQSALKLYPDMNYWQDVFDAIKTNILPPNCGFDWLIKSENNWTKVKERTYELRKPSTGKVNDNASIGIGSTVLKGF